MYRPNTPSHLGPSYILTMLQQACCMLRLIAWNHFRHARCAVTTGIGIGTRYRYRWRSKVLVSVVSVNSGISLTLVTTFRCQLISTCSIHSPSLFAVNVLCNLLTSTIVCAVVCHLLLYSRTLMNSSVLICTVRSCYEITEAQRKIFRSGELWALCTDSWDDVTRHCGCCCYYYYSTVAVQHVLLLQWVCCHCHYYYNNNYNCVMHRTFFVILLLALCRMWYYLFCYY